VASMSVNHRTSSDIERRYCYLLPSLPSVRCDGAVSRVPGEIEKKGKEEANIILLSEDPHQQKFH
jgi:hypothetical protein